MENIVLPQGDSDYSLSDQNRWDDYVLAQRMKHLEEFQQQLIRLATCSDDFWHEASVLMGKIIQSSPVSAMIMKVLKKLGVKEAEMPEEQERRLLILMMIDLALEQKQQYVEMHEMHVQLHSLLARQKAEEKVNDSSWALDEGSIFDDPLLPTEADATTIGEANDTVIMQRPIEPKSELRKQIEALWEKDRFIDVHADPDLPEEGMGI